MHCSESNFDSVHSIDNVIEDDEGDEMTVNVDDSDDDHHDDDDSDGDDDNDDGDNDDANLVDVTLSNREAAAHQGISPP